MVTPYAPMRDGLADYAAFLIAELRSRGHEVNVVCSRRADPVPSDVVGAVPRSPLRAARTAHAIAELHPDVVHIQFCVAAFATAVPGLMLTLSRLRAVGVRVIVTFHDVSRDVAMLGSAGRALYRRLAGLCDAVVVHTETARRLTSEITRGRPADVVVIPYPPTPLPPAGAEPQALAARFGLTDKRVLLAFGFLYVDKGLDDLVRALHLLRGAQGGRFSDVRVAVAGAVRSRRGIFKPFELRDRLHVSRVRSLIRRLGLQDAVVFAGYVPEGDVRPWFELADAAVLPYRRIEQSSVASLARSAGAPIVASDVGELAAFAGRPEWCCRPGSPPTLAAALASFLDGGGRAAAAPAHNGSELAGAVTATLDLYAVPARVAA